MFIFIFISADPCRQHGNTLDKRGQEASGGKPAAKTSKQVGSWQGRKASRKKHRSETSF